MAIKPINKQSFGLKSKNSNVHGDNVYVIKGGSTIIADKWIQFNDIVIDIKQVIYDYLKAQSRRIFNEINGILYVLIVTDKNQNIEVIPSISFNKNIKGDIKSFPELEDKIPLFLVKITQDGSTGLTGIKNIEKNDIEEYRGYGNFTIIGPQGDTGPKGITGSEGPVGNIGVTGISGPQGYQGATGLSGVPVQGITGVNGLDGDTISWPTIDRIEPPIADFVGEPRVGTGILTVTFSDLSTPRGMIDNWFWDFGDNSGSTESNPTKSYSSVGSYTVTLTISNESGDSQEIKEDYIIVTANYQALCT